MSADLLLSTKSTPEPSSFFDRIIRSVSRSIERFTEPKKINYDIEKLNFSRYLTAEVFGKGKKTPNYFTATEIATMDGCRTEQQNFINSMKFNKSSQQNFGSNHEFQSMLSRRRKEQEEEIERLASFKNHEDKFREVIRLTQGRETQKKQRIEDMKFQRMKDLEKRGRQILLLKRIETILKVVQEKKIALPVPVIKQLVESAIKLKDLIRAQVLLQHEVNKERKAEGLQDDVRFYKSLQHLLNTKK